MRAQDADTKADENARDNEEPDFRSCEAFNFFCIPIQHKYNSSPIIQER